MTNCVCDSSRDLLRAKPDEDFRHPGEVAALWCDFNKIDPRQLEYQVKGLWWEILEDSGIVLLVTREYENLMMAMRCCGETGPDISLMMIPHPSGLAVDRTKRMLYVASTRNPNQIYDLVPTDSLMPRLDMESAAPEGKPLIPARIRFLPGCLYVHDLAMIRGELYANSVGQNAVIRILDTGLHERVWWPKCIERDGAPIIGQNHLQLNSIAAGENLNESYFSSSTDVVTDLRPGDPDFPVDQRGVIFSGASREPIARGLTRPHSARLHDGRIWVDNSGYGEVGFIYGDRFQAVQKLNGWTRGLCFFNDIAYIGTSRVLSRFRQYAPGLEVESSRCGIHAVDLRSGEIIGSIEWPYGSQIFSVEWVPADFTTGLPFRDLSPSASDREKSLFYAFQLPVSQEE